MRQLILAFIATTSMPIFADKNETCAGVVPEINWNLDVQTSRRIETMDITGIVYDTKVHPTSHMNSSSPSGKAKIKKLYSINSNFRSLVDLLTTNFNCNNPNLRKLVQEFTRAGQQPILHVKIEFRELTIDQTFKGVQKKETVSVKISIKHPQSADSVRLINVIAAKYNSNSFSHETFNLSDSQYGTAARALNSIEEANDPAKRIIREELIRFSPNPHQPIHDTDATTAI